MAGFSKPSEIIIQVHSYATGKNFFTQPSFHSNVDFYNYLKSIHNFKNESIESFENIPVVFLQVEFPFAHYSGYAEVSYANEDEYIEIILGAYIVRISSGGEWSITID